MDTYQYEYEYHLKQFMDIPKDLDSLIKSRPIQKDKTNVITQILDHPYSKLYHEIATLKENNEYMDDSMIERWENNRRLFVEAFKPRIECIGLLDVIQHII